MGAFEFGCGVVAGLMLLHLGLLGLYAFEHVRFHRSRLRRPIDAHWTPSVTIIVPCKGLELKLEEHLQSLFHLRYPHYELCFVVESATDPVLPVIHDLRRRHSSIPSRVVIAGLATASGQKVHNLIQAVRTVTSETEVLAFVDSDASPHPEWLHRLVSRLQSDPRTISTGYRWFRPVSSALPNLCLAALNNSILLLLGNTWFNLAWGGAWGIRRETFLSLGFPEAWDGTLSDDLIVSRLAHDRGVRIAYEPHCLSVSPASATWSSLVEFARRQYRILRIYTPRWWLASFTAGLLVTSLFGSCAALITWGVFASHPWWWPAGLAVAYFTLTAVRISLQLRGIRPFLNLPLDELSRAERFSVWAWPVLNTFNWLLLATTAFGRCIVWRGIRYRLDSPRQTTILSRPAASIRRAA